MLSTNTTLVLMTDKTDQNIYLDNNATTRPYPEVLETMKPFFEERFGNPSSVHRVGRDARTALDEARQTISDTLNASSPAEITFVSCATEANSLALRGLVNASDQACPHIVTSQVEHPSILETCSALERTGKAEVEYIPVDRNARVIMRDLREAVTDNTLLVSVMTANNEVGTRQPLQQIAELCSQKGVYLHTDAVQAPAKIPVNVQQPDVDMLSLSAHKFHGPRGIGLLYSRKDIELDPILRGGGQENELRSGTEAVSLAAGMATALNRATNRCKETAERMRGLRNQLREGLTNHFGEQLHCNTPLENALPNTLNVSFLHNESDKMLINLDLQGICVSAGSACHSGAIEVSHVLEAMGLDREISESSVRFSLSHENTNEEIEQTLDCLTSEGQPGR